VQEVHRTRALESDQGVMPGIGPRPAQGRAALVVEAPHQGRITGKALGRGDVHDVVPFPQAARTAEGRHAALGRGARAAEDGDSLRLTQDVRGAIDRVFQIVPVDGVVHGRFLWA
jgi:hypothetical protein